MKKILLIIALTIKSILGYSQVIHNNELIKIKLPESTKKLNKKQVATSSIDVKNFTLQNANFIQPYNYQIENMSLGLSNVSNSSIVNDLERMKVFQDNLNLYLIKNGNKTYTSYIKKIGFKTVLITHHISKKIGYYDFYLQNEGRTLTQKGRIDYPEADSAKAAALLNDILNNAQFTQ